MRILHGFRDIEMGQILRFQSLITVFFILLPNLASAQLPPFFQRTINLQLLAGNIYGTGAVDATGTAAELNQAEYLVFDGSGNMYFADTFNQTIRKMNSSGVVTTIAGTPGSWGAANGTGAAAQFKYPKGITIDSSGNLYVTDNYNCSIRKITQAGVVTNFAGTNSSCISPGYDGTGAAAGFFYPVAITSDSSGNLYVADSNDFGIRKITPSGVVTTIAGMLGTGGSTNGTGTAARFFYPAGIGIDSSGNLYIGDTVNNEIRKVTQAGVTTTFAGTAGSAGLVNGTGTAARFHSPSGIAVDGSNNIYIADTGNNVIRMITPGAVTTTYAGTGFAGSSDGPAATAQFSGPTGLNFDNSGNLYVADMGNSVIRKITPGGVVSTVVGTAGVSGGSDGTASAAQFKSPAGLIADSSGNIYVADTGNDTIRKITSSGVVTTLAGSVGVTGSTDATGTAARFNAPSAVAVDSSGTLYIADTTNDTIRNVTSSGVVTTLAGSAGVAGSTDATGTAAKFKAPKGLAVDSLGNVYVADTSNNTIRKIAVGGVVTTLAGTAGTTGSADGTGPGAAFNTPYGIAVDSTGTVYVADTNNDTIRKITSGGVVTTFAGTAGSSGSADGVGTAARFNAPRALAIDSAANLYVADTGNATIRKITPAGVVTTLIGVAGQSFPCLGPIPSTIAGPPSLAIANGVLYFVQNNGIVSVTLP